MQSHPVQVYQERSFTSALFNLEMMPYLGSLVALGYLANNNSITGGLMGTTVLFAGIGFIKLLDVVYSPLYLTQ